MNPFMTGFMEEIKQAFFGMKLAPAISRRYTAAGKMAPKPAPSLVERRHELQPGVRAARAREEAARGVQAAEKKFTVGRMEKVHALQASPVKVKQERVRPALRQALGRFNVPPAEKVVYKRPPMKPRSFLEKV